MASNAVESRTRLRNDGIRCVDHLETGVRSKPERISGAHRLRVDGACSKIRSTFHTLRNWGIILVTSATAGAFFAAFLSKGR